MSGSGTILLISLISGLATSLGAILVFALGRITSGLLSAMLGFAAGIMIALSAFGLLPQALQYGGYLEVGLGFALGAVLMFLVDLLVANLHGTKGRGGNAYLRIGVMVAAGIALHNLPEGLALGAGYQATEELGALLALAIGFHNIPEGLGIAAPLAMSGMGRGKVLLITSLAGLFTLAGTAIGLVLFSVSRGLIAASMGFAAGAMVYIAGDELIPQAHSEHVLLSNVGIVVGFLLVFLLGRF